MSGRYQTKKSRICKPSEGQRATYAAVVKAYEIDHQKDASREMRFFSIQKSLPVAIEFAATARLPGDSKHTHQWRIPNGVLQRFAFRLLAIQGELQAVRDFYALWSLVRREGKRVKGIGELSIYDTAHRIGAFLSIEPEFIYMHAGARAGARALGLSIEGLYLEVEQVPVAPRRLKPYEIEDCLCIYKADLAAMRTRE